MGAECIPPHSTILVSHKEVLISKIEAIQRSIPSVAGRLRGPERGWWIYPMPKPAQLNSTVMSVAYDQVLKQPSYSFGGSGERAQIAVGQRSSWHPKSIWYGGLQIECCDHWLDVVIERLTWQTKQRLDVQLQQNDQLPEGWYYTYMAVTMDPSESDHLHQWLLDDLQISRLPMLRGISWGSSWFFFRCLYHALSHSRDRLSLPITQDWLLKFWPPRLFTIEPIPPDVNSVDDLLVAALGERKLCFLAFEHRGKLQAGVEYSRSRAKPILHSDWQSEPLMHSCMPCELTLNLAEQIGWPPVYTIVDDIQNMWYHQNPRVFPKWRSQKSWTRTYKCELLHSCSV